MARINFKGQAQKQRGLKRAPSKYKESAGRPNISMSPGVAPAYPAVPYKYLPVSFQDVNTQDWVVMPKGKIASMVLSTNQAWTDAEDADGVQQWQTGQKGNGLDNSGQAWGAITAPDDGYYGISKNIKGLLVPCNGGNAMTMTYTDNDALTVPKASGSGVLVSNTDTLSIAANAPIGVMEHDVYQDIRGANLNYDMRNKNWGVLAQQFIKLPCVDLGAWNAFTGLAAPASGKLFVPDAQGASAAGTQVSDAHTSANQGADETVTFVPAVALPAGMNFLITSITVAGGADLTTGFVATADSHIVTIADGTATDGQDIIATYSYYDENAGSDAPNVAMNSNALLGTDYAGYNAVNGYYGFLTFNSEKAGHGLAGGLLKSDCFGNWMHETGNPQSANRTAQTVGRLLGVDYRFEKDLLDTVQSRFEDDAAFRVAGTGTYGVPQYLYNFAYKAMKAVDFDFGASDEAKAIKDACDAGVFGESWIQLNCQ